ncbi:VOC family protein [soil metagenome]
MAQASFASIRASLHHLAFGSPDPAALATFYARALALRIEPEGEAFIGRARGRRLIFQTGPIKSLGFAAYAVESVADLAGLRERAAAAGVAIEPSPSPLFGEEAVCLRDPDGNRFVFGLSSGPEETAIYDGSSAREARLQHVVFASRDAGRLADFYEAVLGFALSDVVVDEVGGVRTSFLRCSEEHHSLAVFQASENRIDHHCYEAGDWGLIRDWGDHMAAEHIPLVWGPGRHGPGDNLFMFVHDADGNWVEISAELEVVTADRPVGTWPHEQRTLNSWGQGLLRS